ncbi:3-deoxy-D-manno-octulosonic acid transferase [Parapedobacter koreensis]|uniref:3-deoxy-D-manno-octulosonic acid transferase n=1 Tax=Parapedobacter koreensis TaxID=332977 RepID=UPI002936F378|nr:glycosyltransferase N-terminal domain-containing protein [Parapedobacter koreensis]
MSPFNDKAKKWIHGRKGLLAQVAREVDRHKGCIWFHFASLGEFEQGRPVLEMLKLQRPGKPIVITFYSPSGYEIRKNTPLATHVFYLPEDTPQNAAIFIQLINPEMAIFTKYEYWYFYFKTLASKGIPLYLISAIFRPNQVFFKWYGGFFRQTLGYVTYFFTQNEESRLLLNRLGFTHASVAGDTRFDRVVTLPETRKHIPEIEAFANGNPVLIAGSTWPADEQLLTHIQERFSSWKIIIAPHEIHEEHLCAIEKLFPQAIRFSDSQLATDHRSPARVLIIDNIGMLSSLYAYGTIAYIGGGFGVGIHNTLEAAAYGLPVIFGPNYRKFQEAKDLIANGAGFSIPDGAALVNAFSQLCNTQLREQAGNTAKQYVQDHAGATARILSHLNVDGDN